MAKTEKMKVKVLKKFRSDVFHRHFVKHEVVEIETTGRTHKVIQEYINGGLMEKSTDKVGKISVKNAVEILKEDRKKLLSIEKQRSEVLKKKKDKIRKASKTKKKVDAETLGETIKGGIKKE